MLDFRCWRGSCTPAPAVERSRVNAPRFSRFGSCTPEPTFESHIVKLDSIEENSFFIPHPSSLFIMRSGAIGDFILTLPALSALRQKFPSHPFILAARADVLPLVKGTLADVVVAFDDPLLTPLFTRDAELAEPLQKLLDNVDLAVVWLPENSARVVANNLRRLGVQRLLCALPPVAAPPTHERGETFSRHAADYLLDTLAPLGPLPTSPVVRGRWGEGPTAAIPRLPLSPAIRALADEFWRARGYTASTRVVAMHVGSGSEAKRWPLENFLALARQWLQADNVRVILITGPAEENWVRRPPQPLSRSTGEGLGWGLPVVIHLDSPPLTTLAAILSKCSLYLGNDSGITHLAAALGVTTVALFGPTDPQIWGPRGEHVSILRSPSTRMEDLSLETVWQVADSR